jgi:hypothetical protein
MKNDIPNNLRKPTTDKTRKTEKQNHEKIDPKKVSPLKIVREKEVESKIEAAKLEKTAEENLGETFYQKALSRAKVNDSNGALMFASMAADENHAAGKKYTIGLKTYRTRIK